MMRSFDEKGEC